MLQQLAGLTDLEVIVYAIREATMIVCTEIELGAATWWPARNRLELRYGMRPLPISDD